MTVLNTLRKRWLRSFSSPPPGEITVGEAGCENPFSTACSPMPTIRSIQFTNLALVFIAAGAMAYFVSTNAALGCLLGGAVVVANLFLLAAIGRFALAAARQSGGVSRLGLAA